MKKNLMLLSVFAFAGFAGAWPWSCMSKKSVHVVKPGHRPSFSGAEGDFVQRNPLRHMTKAQIRAHAATTHREMEEVKAAVDEVVIQHTRIGAALARPIDESRPSQRVLAGALARTQARKTKLEGKIAEHDAAARTAMEKFNAASALNTAADTRAAAKYKETAKQVLRRKKADQKQLDTLNAQRSNVVKTLRVLRDAAVE